MHDPNAINFSSITTLTTVLISGAVFILFSSLIPDTSQLDTVLVETAVNDCYREDNSASNIKEIESGRSLFRENCAVCHNKDMKSDLTGPALGGVLNRWSAYPKEDLYNWIRNSQKMIASNHPKAVDLWKEWKPTIMNQFQHLTDAEIEAILAYIEGP